MVIRPLLPEDVPGAADVAIAGLPAAAHDRSAWMRLRIGHLRSTDPSGAYVATDDDGELIGVGLALVRDGIWGLSLLAVRPDRHARGAGRALLEACLQTARDARGAIIASSTDPKAMRLYARAGFALHPCVALGGLLDRAAIPRHLEARPTTDYELAVAISRKVRGGAYDPADLTALRSSAPMLAVEDRGFAVHRDGSPSMLCAEDEATAIDLLWACFAAATPGATVGVDLLTAGQDWAIQTGLAAGLLLSPDGPIYTRGALGPLRPWVPSGALL